MALSPVTAFPKALFCPPTHYVAAGAEEAWLGGKGSMKVRKRKGEKGGVGEVGLRKRVRRRMLRKGRRGVKGRGNEWW